jgi:hypothetical protein
MTAYPAFEKAANTGDCETLLRLYDAAITQRDRAEAILRSLLNPATSTKAIGDYVADRGPEKQVAHASRYSKPEPPKKPTTKQPTNYTPPELDLDSI